MLKQINKKKEKEKDEAVVNDEDSKGTTVDEDTEKAQSSSLPELRAFLQNALDRVLHHVKNMQDEHIPANRGSYNDF